MNDTIEQTLKVARNDWSRVLAFAWSNEDVLKELRKDPKETIKKLAGKADSAYQGVDNDTKTSALNIILQTEKDPNGSYRGYLPIPDPLEGLKNLTKKDLENLLQNGITGILRFDKKADLWAEELHTAWNEPNKLIDIRQDPVNNLIHARELSEDEFGIFPVPDRPRGLKELRIEQLEEFLSDQDNMEHLGGIFLVGS